MLLRWVLLRWALPRCVLLRWALLRWALLRWALRRWALVRPQVIIIRYDAVVEARVCSYLRAFRPRTCGVK